MELESRRLRVVLDGNSSQWYPVNAGVPQCSILGPTLFLLYISDLPEDAIFDIAIYADDTALYSKCDQASICGNNLNWLLNLSLINKKWLVDFSAGKTQLVLFDQSNTNDSIDVKMDGSVLQEKSSFKMLRLTFLNIMPQPTRPLSPNVPSIHFVSMLLTDQNYQNLLKTGFWKHFVNSKSCRAKM